MNDQEKNKDQLISEIKKSRKEINKLKKRLDLERAREKERLELSDNRFPVILEHMGEAYFELDLAGNFTFFNSAAVLMLGYSSAELYNMNYRDYVSPEMATALFRTFNEIYKTGKPAKIIDYQVIRKDGSEQFREMSASLIRDSQGEPIGFRGIARDITKRKQAEEALKQKDQELEIKSRSLAESNTALKVLLKQREDDKRELERNVVTNVRKIIIPYVQKLRKNQLTLDQIVCIDTIENNIMSITSPFIHNVTLKHLSLTPKEFQVATLIKDGRTSKEIADFLSVSVGAVDFHRNNIRRKLGLKNRKVNLRYRLMSLS
ncbi:MAG: PAS domain S-box protein [Candidatus Izemoplasmatales bacterium]|jgi:PAS domain S-box-containing protein